MVHYLDTADAVSLDNTKHHHHSQQQHQLEQSDIANAKYEASTDSISCPAGSLAPMERDLPNARLHAEAKCPLEETMSLLGGMKTSLHSRLQQRRQRRILIVETGPRPLFIYRLLSRIPLLAPLLFGTRLDWNYRTEPQSYTGRLMKKRVGPDSVQLMCVCMSVRLSIFPILCGGLLKMLL
ncbi:unnamed protein product [Protopolystoma xenopodis]|uniref:Uncharacterized protein n=1 Tax=Protopolystoma xenopodis TaxID=117903 RepID=A0A448WE14_9PLAT|nr:unnamed protein product [Protopolystoma xenopodis]